MNELEALIARTEAELEKNNQDTNIVGNRPHYPMLILFNDSFDGKAFRTVFSKVERIWPQSSHRLVKYRYTAGEEGLSFYQCESGTQDAEEAFLAAIDREQQEHDIFASMTQLLVYNVIDTTDLPDINAFAALYESEKQIKAMTDCRGKTMLIVLLNDSLSKRKLANEIRQYLAAHNAYDSTILVSTRTRNNEIYPISDLYRIVSDLLVVSNNDAVSHLDDEDYRSRFALLYNQTTYTLSYVLCEKPNHRIAIQIIDLILENAKKQLKQPTQKDVSAWCKQLGFENGRSEICENFIAGLRIRIDPRLLEHIPLREIPNDDILARKYKDFCPSSYADVIAGFAETYCKNTLVEDIDVSPCCEQFMYAVGQNVAPNELAELSDGMLDKIFQSLTGGVCHGEMLLPEYLKRQIEIHIRKDLIFPQFRVAVEKLRENSRTVIRKISELQEEFKKYIPLNNENIGTIYQTQTENYLNGQKGAESLGKICNAQNDANGILNGIFACFADLVRENKNLFSLPFIEEWERRLDLTGDRIYREISATLMDKSDDLIRLSGNLPINKCLKLFMLHTTDSEGNNPTKLYDHLKVTFKEDSLVQYFNTGYDDALESLTLISCNGNNLLL